MGFESILEGEHAKEAALQSEVQQLQHEEQAIKNAGDSAASEHAKRVEAQKTAAAAAHLAKAAVQEAAKEKAAANAALNELAEAQGDSPGVAAAAVRSSASALDVTS